VNQQAIPIIDLDGRRSDTPPADVVAEVARAAAGSGFFQVVGHGVDQRSVDAVWEATRRFFEQPLAEKRRLTRTRERTRGYYDRELTKNQRDLKEVFDVAHQAPSADSSTPEGPYRDRPYRDGPNHWPDLPGFRRTIVEHMDRCHELASWLLAAFGLGLGADTALIQSGFTPDHTSFLRLNHYPTADLLSSEEAASVTELGDMALHHHTDSGALTLLLQDEVGGLQAFAEGGWIDVEPTPGAFVVNTGDMAQVWSNDRYRGALHRVLPSRGRQRYSLPYFFNPSYDTDYAPLDAAIEPGNAAHYRSINWGDFRRGRADGDFADYGAEVQISDYVISKAPTTAAHDSPSSQDGEAK